MRTAWITTGLLAVVLAVSAVAQPAGPRGEGRGPRGLGAFGMGGGMMGGMLLNRPDVQRELNLSQQQINQIRQMQEAQRAAMQEMRNLPPQERRQKMQELREKNDPTKVLNESQKKRLRELELQASGALALMNPEVAKEVGLTAEQQSKIQGIMMEQMQAMREQFQGGGFGQGQGMQNLQQMREQMEKRILEVLTPVQRQKWQEMQGKPFQFEGGRPMPGWGGFGGQPRGRQGFGGGQGFGN